MEQKNAKPPNSSYCARTEYNTSVLYDSNPSFYGRQPLRWGVGTCRLSKIDPVHSRSSYLAEIKEPGSPPGRIRSCSKVVTHVVGIMASVLRKSIP